MVYIVHRVSSGIGRGQMKVRVVAGEVMVKGVTFKGGRDPSRST